MKWDSEAKAIFHCLPSGYFFGSQRYFIVCLGQYFIHFIACLGWFFCYFTPCQSYISLISFYFIVGHDYVIYLMAFSMFLHLVSYYCTKSINLPVMLKRVVFAIGWKGEMWAVLEQPKNPQTPTPNLHQPKNTNHTFYLCEGRLWGMHRIDLK